MKIYICNAFSLNMLDRATQARALSNDAMDCMFQGKQRVPTPVGDPNEWLMDMHWACNKAHVGLVIESAVGHPDTARVLSALLDRELPVNRVNVKLTEGTYALIGQYIGPRLAEGATTLPEGAHIEWWFV